MRKTMVSFKPGDKIKLKNYFPCGDWEAHKGEKATIIKQVATYSNSSTNYDWSIEWKDGSSSYAHHDNMILISEDWDE